MRFRLGRKMTMMRRGSIFYDATCGLCSMSRTLFGRAAQRAGFDQRPLQDPDVMALLGLREGEVPPEMKLQTSDGRVLGGVDALLHVSRYIWWAWPTWAVSRVPGIPWLMKWPYKLIARNRYRISKVCRMPAEQR